MHPDSNNATAILRKRLRTETPLLGVCWMYPASGIIESMGAGWDFAWLDGQHGQFSYDSILYGLQAARGMGLATVLRVPSHDPGLLGWYADLAPLALMIPLVDTPQQAQAIVRALRFPPLGNRSYGGRRPIDLEGRSYWQQGSPLIIAQIESPEACEAADEIAAVEGVDALFFGPDDMKLRMGIPLEASAYEHPQLKSVMETVARASLKAGKACGCIAPNAEAAQTATQMGYRLLVGGGDIGFLRSGAAQKLAELRAGIQGITNASKSATAAKAAVY